MRGIPDIYRAPTADWRHGGRSLTLTFGRDVAIHLASADLPGAQSGGLGVAGVDAPDGRWLVVPDGMSLFDAYGHAYRAAGLLLARGVDAGRQLVTTLTSRQAQRRPQVVR